MGYRKLTKWERRKQKFKVWLGTPEAIFWAMYLFLAVIMFWYKGE